jgi:hypothetical protein
MLESLSPLKWIGIMDSDTNRDQIRSLMDRRANIRNMSVIAHGKFNRG